MEALTKTNTADISSASKTPVAPPKSPARDSTKHFKTTDDIPIPNKPEVPYKRPQTSIEQTRKFPTSTPPVKFLSGGQIFTAAPPRRLVPVAPAAALPVQTATSRPTTPSDISWVQFLTKLQLTNYIPNFAKLKSTPSVVCLYDVDDLKELLKVSLLSKFANKY